MSSHRPEPLSPTLSATSSTVSSTASSTASSTRTVMDSHPNPKSLINLGKQLKYLSIGFVLTCYFQVLPHLSDALSLGVWSTLSAKLALLSILLLLGTVVFFTYIILLPARGHNINYLDWRGDHHLGTAIPLLTACIIFGWTTLLLTLSPIGAPAPPPTTIRQRLAQAASFTGLDSLESRIQSLPNSYLSPTTTTTTSKLSNVLGKSNDWDKIASYLSLPNKSPLRDYFVQLSQREDDWAAKNIKVIGWIGALLGSIGAYFFVFGAVGLIGFLAPDRSKEKRNKQF
ncbi:hypothetical protein NDA11_003131 [Ustilago hordei]|nr:hypothetical protein NDA11_003131 [Ustilago hordei]